MTKPINSDALLELAEVIEGVVAKGDAFARSLRGHEADAMFYPQMAVNGTLKLVAEGIRTLATKEPNNEQ